MILASAQTKPKRGDIDYNFKDHYRLIEKASDQGTDLIVFPEMSITGYEREDAYKFTFSESDSRLDNLRKIAHDKKIIVVAGAPIIIDLDLFIGSFILYPDSSISIYTKQFLHLGEEEFFKSSFDYNPIIEFEKERISLAICADINNSVHPENANRCKSSIYMPSIFFTPKGIPDAHILLSNYAKKYSMNILMSNFGGQTWGRDSGGRSAFWNKNGELISEMGDTTSGLLIIKENKGTWTGQIINDK